MLHSLTRESPAKYLYPFSAIVGQEKVKKALILSTVNPKIHGVLIRGEKGTAKSTIVRSFGCLIPQIEVVTGCLYNCNPDDKDTLCSECLSLLQRGNLLPRTFTNIPIAEIPLSATGDMVIGSIAFSRVIKLGGIYFEPGIVAKANRGIIYVDEINLLDDYIVDSLLDVASSGINIVEREGVSCAHPAKFILIGTMNPEEGELRPQLIDRFGLCVSVQGIKDNTQRVEIIRRREAFDTDPVLFSERWQPKGLSITQKIGKAQRQLNRVHIPQTAIDLIVRLCAEANVSGHRAEIIMAEASRAAAAWAGQNEVTSENIYEIAELVLEHRAKELSGSPHSEENKKQESHDEQPRHQEKPPQDGKDNNKHDLSAGKDGDTVSQEVPSGSGGEQKPEREENREHNLSGEKETRFDTGLAFNVRNIQDGQHRISRIGKGRRSITKTSSKTGRYVRSTMHIERYDLAFDATLRAAAPYQRYRNRENVALVIKEPDLREKVRQKRIGNLLLFTVDASGSMNARRRMIETKAAILSLLMDAYRKRDKIGMVAFKGHTADVLLQPTGSIELAKRLLDDLPTGGRTPLAAGLHKSYEIITGHLRKEPDILPLLIVITDGRANKSIGSGHPWDEVSYIAQNIKQEAKIKSLVVDTENINLIKFGMSEKLASMLGAEYLKMEELKAEDLVSAVSDLRK